MSRTTYVLRDGQLVDKSIAPPLHEADASFHFISDTMGATQHMADGKFYTSESAFRRATRDAGCIEVGTEKLKPFTPPKLDKQQRARDIKTAIDQLRAGYRPG